MKKIVTVLLLTSMLLYSCKKQKGATVDLNGYWDGKWGYNTAAPSYKMAVIFRANGTARVIYGYTADTSGAVYKTENTYKYTSGELRFSYREGSYTFMHAAKPSGNNMSGTWGTSPSTTDGGNFFLDKK